MRWLAVVLGVGVAAAALYALLERPSERRVAHPEIDPRSRAQLDRVIEREAKP
jgi:hypothetical protein